MSEVSLYRVYVSRARKQVRPVGNEVPNFVFRAIGQLQN